MKTLIILFIVFSSTLSFACADLKNKPKYLAHDQIKCGSLLNTIVHPKVILKGKTYAMALNLSDMSGVCPDADRGCFRPWHNIVNQGNVVCKAYGFGPYADSNSYSPLFHYDHSTPDLMVEMKKINKTTYVPRLFRMNHSRSEFSEIRELKCHKVYRK